MDKPFYRRTHNYYRARLGLIEKLKGEVVDEQQKNYLQAGYIHPELYPEGIDNEEDFVRQELEAGEYSNAPLTFTEITSGSTWFAMYPEKIAGEEKPTTSIFFPVTIKGDRKAIYDAIYKGIKGRPHYAKSPTALKLKAKAMKLKLDLLKMERERKQDLSGTMPNYALAGIGLSGEGFLAGLGALNADTEQKADALVVSEVLEKSKQDKAYSKEKQSFDQIFEEYNKGISENEIKAWVWYKRSLGYPMTYWKKWWMGSTTGAESTYVVTKQSTTLLDNRWQPIQTVPQNATIGRPTKFEHEYKGVNHLIVVGEDGSKFILVKDHVKITATGQKVAQKDLDKLVKSNALFYLAGELVPYPVYAFGNMYERENQLAEDKEEIISTYGQQVYDHHLSVIQKAKPKVISIQNPDANERPKILVFSSFALEYKITHFREDVTTELNVPEDEGMSLKEAFKVWVDGLSRDELGNLSSFQIRHYYVNNASMRGMTDEEKQMIERYAPLEGEQLFSRFLHEALTFEDQVRLDRMWNEVYNGWSDIPYTKVPIGFECSGKFKLSHELKFSPAQREAIAFSEIAGSGIIAYDVGVGKTMAAIISVANAIYAGRTKRPCIVVPNPTYAKWVKEIIGYEDKKTGEFFPGVLSYTGMKVNEWYNLGKKMLSKINLEKPVPENSITVMTYEAFVKIGFSQKLMNEVFEELQEVLQQRGEEDDVRNFEKKKLTYYELIGVGQKDTIADIDTLGFDYLVIDEAHNFKNVFADSPKDEQGQKRFKITGAASARGLKCFFLTNYIQRKFGRNVMLLTATPFTNSPLEIFSMLSMVAYEKLAAAGIKNLQVFMETFILQSLEYVNSYDGGIREQHVVKSFNNRLILQKMIHNHIAYKTGEDAGVKRPCKINLPRIYQRDENGVAKRLPTGEQILTYLEMNEEQKMNQQEIIALAMQKSKMANIFRAMAMSLDNALSPFLYVGSLPPEDHVDFVEKSPKIFYTVQCIKSVKEYHESQDKPVSGQVVYMNRGKEYFPMLKRYLEEEVGYKTGVKHNGKRFDEVEIISSGISPNKKEGIKDAFLDNVVKVIIGTATIKEGIDLQTHGTVLYNCYADYNPTDLKQVEGRIHRQGNEYAYVRVAMPLVQDSMDVFVFQKLEEKTARINDIWYRSDRGNVLDQETLDPEEVKFALFTDMRALASIELDKEKKEVYRTLSITNDNFTLIANLKAIVDAFYNQQERLRQMLSENNQVFVDQVLNENSQFKSSPGWNHHSESKQKSILERAKNLTEETTEFLHSAMDDKDLIRIARKHNTLLNDLYQSNRSYQLDRLMSDFRLNLSKIRKAEKTTLAQKGYTIDDDFEVIKAEIRKDIEQLEEELESLGSPDYFAQKVAEVQAKKDRLAIKGGTAMERVQDFESLNHLLSIPFNADKAGYCDIPKPNGQAPKPKADKTKVLRLRAKAVKLKLQLLAQQRERELEVA